MAEPRYETDWSPAAMHEARRLFVARTDEGRVELAICVECGVWTRWDSDVTKYGHCVEGKPHRVSRVKVMVAP